MDKEKQLTAVIEKVLKDTQNCDMPIETLTDYLVDRIKDKVFPKDSVVLTREEYSDYLILQKNHEFIREKAKELQADNERLYKNIGKFKEIVSKETAEKILKWLDNNCVFGGFEVVKTWFKEQFGVEIKE